MGVYDSANAGVGMPHPLGGGTPAHQAPAAHIPKEERWSEVFLQGVDNHRWLLLGIMLLFYLGGFNGKWHMGSPDSGLYLSLGRNLATGKGYTYQGQPHDLVYPGLPWALEFVYRAFGPSHYIQAANAMILLFGLASLVLTFWFVYLATDRATAVVVTLGVGFAHELFRYCYEILTDVPFLFGVMAVFVGYELLFPPRDVHRSRRAGLIGWPLIALGLVVTVFDRPTMLGFIGAWLAAMLWALLRRDLRLRALVGIALMVGVVLLFFHVDPRGTLPPPTPPKVIAVVPGQPAPPTTVPATAPTVVAPPPGPLGGHYEQTAVADVTTHLSGRWSEVAANMKDFFGRSSARAILGKPLGTWWLNAFFGTVILLVCVADARRRPLWGLWVVVTITMLVFIVSHDRYIIEILPLLVLAWWRTIRTICARLPIVPANIACIGLLGLGTVLNIGSVGVVVFNQHWEPFYVHYRATGDGSFENGRYPAYIKLAEELPKYTTPQDVIIAPSDRVGTMLSFLADRRVREINQEFASLPVSRYFVVYDPASEEMQHWMKIYDVTLQGKPLDVVPREAGKPPLELYLAKRS
jgi:hypothetical protein